MSDFNSLVQYTVENISRPVKYIIYKLTEFIRVVDKFVFRQDPAGAACEHKHTYYGCTYADNDLQ